MLATQAYRRTVTDAEVDDLVKYYSQARGSGTFQDGIQFGLRRILASPSFVFRPEIEPPSLSAGTPYRVTDEELATRLSFFL